MMVCHCNVMTCAEIRRAVHDLRRGDAHGIVTPGRVFACCGKRPNCGSCMPLVTRLIAETVVDPAPVRTIVLGADVASVIAQDDRVEPQRDAA